MLTGIEDPNDILHLERGFNLIISLIFLWHLLLFIQNLKLPDKLYPAFALFWVLNPELISVGALITNDVLLFLIGLILCNKLFKYWEKPSWRQTLVVLALCALAAVVKGNGLVFIMAFALVAFFLFLRKMLIFKTLSLTALATLIAVVLIAFGGNYVRKYHENGNPFVINQLKPVKANWIKPDTVFQGRKGVTSVAESFLTFRAKSLFKKPFNTNNSTDYPVHRTSFFTQFFGQFSNYFFESHPPSWHTNNNDARNLILLNYAIHLPLFFWFVVWILIASIKQIRKPGAQRTVHLLLFWLFLFFVMRYTLIYRDFGNMKVMFMFPIIASLTWLHAESIRKFKWQKLLTVALYTCSILYTVNLFYLVRQLVR